MKTTLLALLITLSPVATQAFTVPETLPYTDAHHFTFQQEVAIGVLTELGAVSGNPDGSFAASRTLNRAEFVKIALASHPAIDPVQFVPDNCFPDVARTDWFSEYVCFAKANGIVGGYPDGTFKPEQTVNYAEALKILGELYQHPIVVQEEENWYQPYFEIAALKGITLAVQPAAPLNRGQMARMAAYYYVEAQGELAEYKQFERGQILSSSSSSQSSVASSASETSESSSSESSEESSSSAEVAEITAESGFLFPGEVGEPLVKGVFTSPADGYVRIVNLRLNAEIRSFERLELLSETGAIVGIFGLEFGDSNDKSWQAELPDQQLFIAANVPTTYFVRPVLKTIAQGASAGEFIQPERFGLTLQKIGTNESIDLVDTTVTYPAHHVVASMITSFSLSGATTGTLTPARFASLGSFIVDANTARAPLSLKTITFEVNKSGTVTISSPVLRDANGNANPCQTSGNNIICIITNSQLATIYGSTTLKITGDVALQPGEIGELQITIPDAGTFGLAGSVRWTDGGTEYNWLPLDAPLVELTKWEVGN